jgi:hypothetical protein
MIEEVVPSPTVNSLQSQGFVAHEGLEVIEGFLSTLIIHWETEHQSQSKWLWFFKTKVGLAKCVRFIVEATDGFIVLAERVGDAGSGRAKKSLVTNALDRLYTRVVHPNLPIWLKPFGWLVRLIVIRLIISALIDLCVSKYNQGDWNAEKKEAEVKAMIAQSLISQGLKKQQF